MKVWLCEMYFGYVDTETDEYFPVVVCKAFHSREIMKLWSRSVEAGKVEAHKQALALDPCGVPKLEAFEYEGTHERLVELV